MARAGLGLGVRELAALAEVSTNTITRLERGEALYPRTVEAIRSALEAAGVQFISEEGGVSGVKINHHKILG
ncbi:MULTISPECIES: helix-turn-helix domain-containing protein [Acetobacter]|nr:MULTISPECIES: helix-turn-helix transcriptional regulator [Acetobacter]